jgi:hypothetical protein
MHNCSIALRCIYTVKYSFQSHLPMHLFQASDCYITLLEWLLYSAIWVVVILYTATWVVVLIYNATWVVGIIYSATWVVVIIYNATWVVAIIYSKSLIKILIINYKMQIKIFSFQFHLFFTLYPMSVDTFENTAPGLKQKLVLKLIIYWFRHVLYWVFVEYIHLHVSECLLHNIQNKK